MRIADQDQAQGPVNARHLKMAAGDLAADTRTDAYHTVLPHAQHEMVRPN